MLTFGGIITVIFVVCKLIGQIDWSWSWIFAPLWISAVLDIVIFFIISAIIEGKMGW